jgi:hypothetical protein
VTTGLDVLADAVKIGLGATVALIGTTLARRDEWKKDRLRNRLQAIERVGEEFDAGFHKFADYMTDALAKKALDIRVDTPLELLEEGRRGLFRAEALLMIMGAKEACAAIHAYGHTMRAAIDFLKSPQPGPSDDTIQSMRAARFAVFEALQKEYARLRG